MRNSSRCTRPKAGWWNNFDKYIVSLLKAYYGEYATKDNDFGFNWLPRVTGDHSHLGYWIEMADGKIDGLFVMGQNPAVGAPNSRMERKALAKLKWLVVRDMVETETASFWLDSPEVRARRTCVRKRSTRKCFCSPPPAMPRRKDASPTRRGSTSFTKRRSNPPGDARSETWFMYHLGRRLKEKARKDPCSKNAGLNALTWEYTLEGAIAEPKVEEVLQEINGWTTNDSTPADRKLVSGYKDLKADGSTACGCWIYSGIFPKPGENLANKREPRDFYGHGWGFAWPSDRRILYNRASARPDGQPWSERKKLVWWDANQNKWIGNDVPDFTATKSPEYRPQPDAQGDDRLGGDKPFIMHPEGLGRLFVPSGLKDGPLPTHYEPLESPVGNALYPERQNKSRS